MTADAEKFSGPYQGVVVSNVDPLNLNRLMVRVDDVLGADPCIWATPSAGVAGMHVVPMVGSGVWIQFQDDDIDRAIWSGFWRGGTADTLPVTQTLPPGAPAVVLGTPIGNYLMITDAPGPAGGIQLQLHGPGGPYIRINESGIELSCGPGLATIRLAGSIVTVNNDALTVLS
jgi:hypothetical protein